MWKEAAAWMAGLGCACLALSEYEKKHFSVEAVARLPFFRLVISLSKKYCNLPAAHCASCARHKMRPNVDWIPESGRFNADIMRSTDSTVAASPL